MKNNRKINAKDIAITGVMAALVFLGTFLFKIPTISGYNHIGDSMLILTVGLFGTRKGVLAGAIGAALADLAGGFVYWILPTFIIKGIWALVMGMIMYKLLKGKKGAFLTGAIIGGLTQVILYTLCRIVIYGLNTAIIEIPGLCFQTIFGLIIGFVLYTILKRYRFF